MGVKTVIFDIDGTLADVEHRRHHVAQSPKNWPAFFAEMEKDPPVKDVVEFCQHMLMQQSAGHSIRVVFCSGRGEEYRAVTETWLHTYVWIVFRKERSYGFVPLDLRMRPAADSRSDDVIKKEMLDALRAEGHDIWFVVDDRQRVVDMWRQNGVTVLQCAPGDFDKPKGFNYVPTPGQRLLTLMIGPSGAGKSTQAEILRLSRWLQPNAVISSDKVRQEMFNDFRDQQDNPRVFSYVHDLAKARLKHGLPTVIDATHLHRKDRLAAAALAPDGSTVEYIVVDRPLDQKIRDGGWRNTVIKDGKTLIERHDLSMKGSIKDILRGDGLPNVVVTDLRVSA